MKKYFSFLCIIFFLFLFSCSFQKPETIKIKLFYYNQALDTNQSCAEQFVVPVEREIIKNNTNIILQTLNLLLAWPTEEEKTKWLTSEFPHKGFQIKNISLDKSNGILTLDFPIIPWFTSWGSCRVGLLNASIQKTAKQFAEVKDVKYTSEEIFQP